MPHQNNTHRTPYAKKALLLDGTLSGVITIDSTRDFRWGATVFLESATAPIKQLLVEEILTCTTMVLRDPLVKSSFTFFDCRPWTIADGATITQPNQEDLYDKGHGEKPCCEDKVFIDGADDVGSDFDAKCLSSDNVGDCVYITGVDVAGKHQVAKSDITNYLKVPVMAIIVSKSSSTTCVLHWLGPLQDFSGLTPGRVVFAGADGRPTQVVPVPSSGNSNYLQRIGVALSNDTILFIPDLNLVKLRN